VLALLQLLAMDMTVLNLAVPSLSEDLRPRVYSSCGSFDIYGFLIAGVAITRDPWRPHWTPAIVAHRCSSVLVLRRLRLHISKSAGC
jgi:hypothetical protein